MGWALVYSCESPVVINDSPLPAEKLWVLLIVCPWESVIILTADPAVIVGKIGAT